MFERARVVAARWHSARGHNVLNTGWVRTRRHEPTQGFQPFGGFARHPRGKQLVRLPEIPGIGFEAKKIGSRMETLIEEIGQNELRKRTFPGEADP